ncbi:three-helix bundle dimerization domain-containing protein [Arthrobacter sp. MDT3-24]
MSEDSKDHIVTVVVSRLAARYPVAPRAQIEEIVREEYDTLDTGRIRTFIPTLVEHSARNRLHREFPGQHSDR